MRDTSTAPSRSGSGIEAFGRDVQIEHWVAEQLAAATPLTPEQLSRLHPLLATDPVLARTSA